MTFPVGTLWWDNPSKAATMHLDILRSEESYRLLTPKWQTVARAVVEAQRRGVSARKTLSLVGSIDGHNDGGE